MNTYHSAFIHTLKESPRDAEVVSHQLMVRAGMIKKVAAGIYSVLPLGQRVFNKMNAIIRDEMAAIGGVECTMPASIPAELWQTSGRWDHYGKELLRFEDRQGRPFCFGPTHEEVITDLVASYVTSYKQLPVMLYQIQSKFRDEIRPRFGLMRGREFLMNDAYSFHDTPLSLDDTYQASRRAYSAIFKRCGLDFIEAAADSGSIGGDVSAVFLVVADSGEDEVLVSGDSGFAANVEACDCIDEFEPPVPTNEIETVHTPSKKSIEEVAQFLSLPSSQCIKSLLVMVDGEPVMLCVSGDRTLNEAKVSRLIGSFSYATNEEIVQYLKCEPGFIGPVGVSTIRIVLDFSLKQHSDYCCGANNIDEHLLHVAPERDIQSFEWADIKNAMAGDPCPNDPAQPLISKRGIEVGHVFKLGQKYSVAMSAEFNDSNGKRQPFEMGCYGIGVGRTIAAAIEQSHDENGIIWPAALAPFHVVIVHLCPQDDEMNSLVDKLVSLIEGFGNDVIVDDRKESPGKKFKDADLIGFPYQIVIGRKVMDAGVFELKSRKTGEVVEIPLNNLSQLEPHL